MKVVTTTQRSSLIPGLSNWLPNIAEWFTFHMKDLFWEFLGLYRREQLKENQVVASCLFMFVVLGLGL